MPAGVRNPLTIGEPLAAAGVPVHPVNFTAVLPAHCTRVPLSQMVVPLTKLAVELTLMLLSPATVAAVSVVEAAPGESAIGGRFAFTGPYPAGGAAFQLPSSSTGASGVTPGRLRMSAAVSDSRIRRLAFV